MKYIIIFALFFSLVPCGSAQDLSRGKSVKDIENARKSATLKITIIVNDKTEEFSGFFYGKDGHFVTVHHALRASNFFFSKNAKFNIMDADGNEFSDAVVNSCTNENKVDICIGQIKNYKPKNYFVYNGSLTIKGSDFNSFGACKDAFSSKKGNVTNVTDNYQASYSGAWQDVYNKKTKLLELSIPSCVGDSGGALFEPFTGNLIGMYSFALNGKYFAIDASEIDKYHKSYSNKIEATLGRDMFFTLKKKTEDDDPCLGKELSPKEKEFCSQ